jgi:molybdopterin-guanine dinucleotide biosynthesis protein A
VAIANREITGIVLCGGRGSRMGGRDKPLLEYRGRPLVDHVCQAIRGSVATLLISANRNLDIYQHYGVVVQDDLADHGPLSGIESCLNKVHGPYAFVCPGDAPDLDRRIIQRLATALVDSQSNVAVAHDGKQRQNLNLLLRASVQPDIKAYLKTGERSVKGWLMQAQTIEVDCADIAPSFLDLDEPDDFA